MAGLRAAVRAHHLFTEDATRVKNRLRALYRSRGLGATGSDLYDPNLRKPWIIRLPEHLRSLATALGEQLDKLTEINERANKELRTEAKRHPAVRLLQTGPGIGPVRAAEIVAIVVTPERFRTARQFRKYCGLGIVTVVSSQWTRQDGKWVGKNMPLPRGLNRNHNPWLKSVFKGAAHDVITRLPDHPLNKDYQRAVAAGTKPALAELTLARRIAGAELAMWKHKEEYDPAKHCRQTQA